MKIQEHNAATIAAIATPPGTGGIGIIRISGAFALPILTGLFKPRTKRAKFHSHKMYYGWIVNPGTDRVVDEVLAVYMRAPNTYTRDDVVEIHCHGSYLLLQEILGLILEAGAVLAEPGEFTKRAFLSGRIDLTRAEAVLEILQAKTPESLKMAMAQLQGRLYQRVLEIRSSLVSLRSIIEVAIDFPDDDIEILDPEKFEEQLVREVLNPLDELIAAADRGKIFFQGVAVVILGRPNVGKSSLLNSLLREERAIVTPVPGTTRDTIEEYLDIRGIPVRIIDTAGIRNAEGEIEELGIKRSRQKLESADLVLFMIDGSEPLSDQDTELYASVAEKPMLLVANKIDKLGKFDDAPIKCRFPGRTIIFISAKTHAGLDNLEEAIFTQITGGAMKGDPDQDCVPNIRHKASLTKARDAVQGVLAGTTILSPDLLAIDLQTSLDHLGDIVGETDVEDILDFIFEGFCIGK
ncbi:MAG: tRNA uridine-5-carboxymethylaminomethyl(34) synthesis GTPase MnmE [Proteobacteria bacterium]|nr:tRNA uridine-5-carboxymethylaminomethyl(34) synthesis GTPase MnmE [Pseudomonadota bacterium]MBU1708603.1 tRNA uridine-5-carboxymethylaminomethyl(34) synthesis GTPase MnmE [Pseudomonadota bacterium]